MEVFDSDKWDAPSSLCFPSHIHIHSHRHRQRAADPYLYWLGPSSSKLHTRYTVIQALWKCVLCVRTLGKVWALLTGSLFCVLEHLSAVPPPKMAAGAEKCPLHSPEDPACVSMCVCYRKSCVKVKCLDVFIFVECDCPCTPARFFGDRGVLGVSLGISFLQRRALKVKVHILSLSS